MFLFLCPQHLSTEPMPAECDNIKLPIEYEIASRWDANLLYDICRHFASVMLHFASLISHNLRCIPAYAHLIPTGFFLLNYHRGNLYIISYFQFGDTLLVCIETCQRHIPTSFFLKPNLDSGKNSGGKSACNHKNFIIFVR